MCYRAGDPPDRVEPDRVETVRDGGRTRLVRLVFPDRTVIVKEPLGPDAGQRLRHETTMLERLRGVTGVAQLADVPRYPGSIVLADAGRISLSEVVKPLAADDLTVLAMKLAQAVAGMHRREVMHRDIAPHRFRDQLLGQPLPA